MSNPFANTLNTSNEDIGGDSDRLGGSFLWDSDAYLVTVLSAFAGKSAGGAGSVTLEVQAEDGRKYKFTEYVTSGDAKGNKPYYEKDGKKNYLPGFNNVNAIAMFTTGKELGALTCETKIAKIRNKDTKTDVPTEVPMYVEMIGKQFILGLQRVEVNKTVKVGNKYEPVAKKGEPTVPDTKEQNEIGKIFYATNKCTIAELIAAKKAGVTPVAAFYPQWVEANAGKVINKVKTDVKLVPAPGEDGPAGTPQSADGSAVDSLFE